ncbi:MAG: 2'-5' RNA ligase family protein [Pseudomonadota bacterium]
MIYVLAYPAFEPNTAARIRTFREMHEPDRAKLVPPHITLVFGMDDIHLAAVSERVDTVSRQARAVPVLFDRHVSAFDPFEETHKIFLLCGDGRAEITSLHTQLYDGAHRSELSPAHSFEPHMTVGAYRDGAALDRVDISAVGQFPIKGLVSSLELVRLDGEKLTTLRSMPLGA